MACLMKRGVGYAEAGGLGQNHDVDRQRNILPETKGKACERKTETIFTHLFYDSYIQKLTLYTNGPQSYLYFDPKYIMTQIIMTQNIKVQSLMEPLF